MKKLPVFISGGFVVCECRRRFRSLCAVAKGHLCAFLSALVFLCAATQSKAIGLDFSTIDLGATGAGVRFTGGPGDNDTFTFVNNPGGFTLVIALSSGAGDSVGLPGTITGTFTIGPVSIAGPVQTASVMGTPGARLSIIDGAATFSGLINWVQITTLGTSGFLNSSGVINLTGLTYNGTKSDLIALASAPGATATLQFGFVPARSLTELKADGAVNFTTFTGDINATNPPSCDCALVCATNKAVQCNQGWTFDPPTATGSCSNAPISIFSTVTNASGCGFLATRTWQVVDSCGNTNRCSQTVTVRDTIPPVLVDVPTNQTFQCLGDVLAPPAVTATDNCGPVTVVLTSVTNGSCPTVITRTWTATDSCTNSASATRTITVNDTIPPVLIGVPGNTNYQCLSDVPPLPNVTATDNCAGSLPVTVTAVTNGSCPTVITVTWFARDQCTNSASATRTITVNDTIPPVLVGVPGNTNYQCLSGVPPLPNVTATDNCAGSVPVTVTAVTNGGCPTVITVTWSARDQCTNSASATRTITIQDTTPPVITCSSNKTVECGDRWSFDVPTFTDTCSAATLSIVSTVTNATTCVIEITRTWEAVDACTNRAQCSQTVTVRDTRPPAILCVSNKTVGCGDVWSFDPPSALDLCAGTNVTIKVISTQTNKLSCKIEITRTWEATDPCTNAARCTQTVTVPDPASPLISCSPDKTVDCTNTWTFDPPTATDPCGGTNLPVAVVSTVTNSSACSSIITRTWRATGPCGKVSECSQTVTVNCGRNTCIPGTFTFSGSSSDNGSPNYRKFTVNGVTVKVTGFSRTKDTGIWAPAYVGLYSAGLGVTDTSESGSEPTHAVDNVDRDNFLLFEFMQPVIVDKAYLGWVSSDSDLNAWVGTFPDPNNSHALSDSVLASFTLTDENPGGSSVRLADLNSGNVSGNAFIIAAHAYDASGNKITDTKDQFKVNKLDFCKPDCTPPPPPVCNSGEFTFSGSGSSTGSPNVRTFIANNGVMVNVTAFSRIKDTGAWAPAYVGIYSGGLGVTDTTEDGGDPSHTVDNVGRDNYLLFEFSQKVILDKVYLGFVDTDSDLTAWIGTTSDPFNAHNALSDAFLTGLGFTEENTTSSSSTRWADLNNGSPQIVGNVVVISASVKNADKYKDQFKLKLLDFCTPDPLPALPSPWKTKDIGSVGAAGGANYNSSTKTFNVLGSGTDIGSYEDEFRFVYIPASDNCSIVARVASIQNTHPWAKAGVMIRESTYDDSKEASVVISPESGVAFLVRTSSEGNTTKLNNPPGVTAPEWVKIERVGSIFTASYSSTGAPGSWISLGSRTISMNSSVYIGLVVSSHNDGTLSLATFDNVTAVP